jgi:predicted transcriptional regulator
MSEVNESVKTVTARVAADKVAALDELAGHQSRDRSYLINEAIDQYLSHRQWMLKETRKAMAEIEAGAVLSESESDEFMKELGR